MQFPNLCFEHFSPQILEFSRKGEWNYEWELVAGETKHTVEEIWTIVQKSFTYPVDKNPMRRGLDLFRGNFDREIRVSNHAYIEFTAVGLRYERGINNSVGWHFPSVGAIKNVIIIIGAHVLSAIKLIGRYARQTIFPSFSFPSPLFEFRFDPRITRSWFNITYLAISLETFRGNFTRIKLNYNSIKDRYSHPTFLYPIENFLSNI